MLRYEPVNLLLQAPFLELDDGSKLTQSAAISMYCAGVAGMLPSDPFEVARTIELANTLEDVRLIRPLWCFVTGATRCVHKSVHNTTLISATHVLQRDEARRKATRIRAVEPERYTQRAWSCPLL